MAENEAQAPATAPAAGGEGTQSELSPTEKIEGEPPAGSTEPGVVKPESEVQNEVNPNTE